MSDYNISIIIPAYNAEMYIGKCLKSIRGFSEKKLEILVINDGSKDNTVNIVKECIEVDGRIKLITIPNGGVSKARNKGLDEASGSYIMFLDADDFLIENSFDAVSGIIKSDKYDFVAFSRNIFEEGKQSKTDRFFFEEKETNDKTIADTIMFADSHFNECWGKLYKRKIIENYGIRFPEGVPIGEDMMFVMEYYMHCDKVLISNDALVGYRQHGGSAMRKYCVTERLAYTQNLFDYAKKYVPQKLIEQFWFYNFKILTNLCREYSKNRIDKESIKKIYSSEMAFEVLAELKPDNIPKYRYHEYFIMKNRLYSVSALYYHLKSQA